MAPYLERTGSGWGGPYIKLEFHYWRSRREWILGVNQLSVHWLVGWLTLQNKFEGPEVEGTCSVALVAMTPLGGLSNHRGLGGLSINK